MKRLFAGSTCLAAVLAFGVTTMAQSAQPPAQPPTAQPPTAQPPAAAPQEMKTAAQQVTLIGCVQKEADYRRAKDGTRGGVAGTGAGVGNEFVLINASVSPAPAGTSGTPGAAKAEAPAGTEAFELTGSAETQAEAFVGKRVEITGKLKAAETSATGTTGGRTE